MDIVFWSITLIVSAFVIYLMGFITGYNSAVKEEDEYQREKEKTEEASKRGELL